MQAAARDMDEMIAGWGMNEEEFMAEKELRQIAREKKRQARGAIAKELASSPQRSMGKFSMRNRRGVMPKYFLNSRKKLLES